MSATLPVAVFASGGGTNLQALLDYEARGARYRVVLVVSDRADAGALERARSAGRAAVHVPVRERDASDVARDTLRALETHGVQAVFLAGYLRLVPAEVVEAFPGRMLNVHPALLPAFGGQGMYGRRVHEAVVAAGARVSGVTVHFVDEHYDTGRIFAQWPVPVRPDDDAERLAARVLAVEHRLYPAAADHLAAALLRGEPPRPFTPAGDFFTLGADPPRFTPTRDP